MERPQPDLNNLLCRLQDRFGDALVSVVLYGSHARGESEEGSDVDLLVVLPNLPHEWREIFAIEDELTQLGPGLGARLDVRLAEPESVSHAVTSATPLMLEIYDAHRIVFDPGGFFTAEMSRFAEVIRDRGILKLRRGVWRVPALGHQ